MQTELINVHTAPLSSSLHYHFPLPLSESLAFLILFPVWKMYMYMYMYMFLDICTRYMQGHPRVYRI